MTMSMVFRFALLLTRSCAYHVYSRCILRYPTDEVVRVGVCAIKVTWWVCAGVCGVYCKEWTPRREAVPFQGHVSLDQRTVDRNHRKSA